MVPRPVRARRCAAAVVAALVAAACSSGGEAADPPSSAAPATERTTTTSERTTTTTEPETTSSTTSSTVPPPTFVPADPACPPVPARAEPAADRQVHRAALTIDPTTGEVAGGFSIRFTPDLPIDRLVVRLWANSPRPAAGGVVAAVSELSVDGAPVMSRSTDPTLLEVPLAEPVDAGQRIRIRGRLRVVVPNPTGDRVSRTGDAIRLGSFLPLLPWEPGVGWSTPPPTSGFAEATLSPTADWHVRIRVPDGYTALASGRPDDTGTWHARAMRDFAVSVGRFDVVRRTVPAPHPVEVTVGVHDGIGESPGEYLDRVEMSLRWLATSYGPYPWRTYTLAITPDLPGGIEFPSHVMQGPGTIGRTTPHEVAHMWFYGLVGNDQSRDPWIDEGLATWAEYRIEGNEDELTPGIIGPAVVGHGGEPMAYWEAHLDDYYEGVYLQPAVALAQLAAPETVDCALAHLVAGTGHQIATGDDVVAALDVVIDDPAAALAPYGLP